MANWDSAIKWSGSRGLAQYAKHIPWLRRETLYKFVNKGVAPPAGLPRLTRDEIWDPRPEIQRQMDSKPGFLEALLRDRIKKIRSGVLAGPIHGGLLANIGGKSVIVMPSQDLYNSNLALMAAEQDKTHLCYDFSRNLIGNVALKGGTDSYRSQDLSSLYSNDENTCSLDQLRDKAAFCAAFDAAGKYNIKGYFSQCRANMELRRYQAELLPTGGGTFAVYINMNIKFGNTKAVSWCRAGFSAIHRALDTIAPEVFSTSSFHAPSSLGMKPSSWLIQAIPREKGPCRERGSWFNKWKTRSDRPQTAAETIESSLIFVGGTVVGAVDRGVVPATAAADERIRKAVGSLRAHGIKISEAKIEPAAESITVAGTELNFRDNSLSFPTEKWLAFDKIVGAVTGAKGEISIETILRATRVAVEVSNLFHPIRAYLAPICRWAALYARIREGNITERLRKKRILKETRLEVPEILRDLLAWGWRWAQERRVVHCHHLLMSRNDATCTISADVAGEQRIRTGMGAINHSTLQMFREDISRNHQLSNWPRDWQESCCALGALEVLTRPGDTVVFHESKRTTYNDMLSCKADAMPAPFVIRFAQICNEKNLTLLPKKHPDESLNNSNRAIRSRLKGIHSIRNMKTNSPSSWAFPKESTIFDKKCGDWGIDPERIEVISWNWRRTYEAWMKIQTNYSLLDHPRTKGQDRFPFYSSSKSGLVFQGGRFRA